MAKENPLEYVAKKYEVDTCTCIKKTGDILTFNQSNAWLETRERYFGLDIELFKIIEEGKI